jgi:hypothetical protein
VIIGLDGCSSGGRIAMRCVTPITLTLLILSGCANSTYRYPSTTPIANNPAGVQLLSNPVFISGTDHEFIWETVVDVIDDYFRVESEIRPTGDCVTEGVLRTYPLTGATILEPWLSDSANAYERLESTLQTIRRYSVVHVRPSQGGFWIDVAVFKELENNTRPIQSTASAATLLRYDTSLTRVVDPVGEQEGHAGWIPQGRDLALEQRILGQLQWRFSGNGTPLPLQ